MNILEALEQRAKMERQITLLEESIFNMAKNDDDNATLLSEIVSELQLKIEYMNRVLASVNYPADKLKHGDWNPAG